MTGEQMLLNGLLAKFGVKKEDIDKLMSFAARVPDIVQAIQLMVNNIDKRLTALQNDNLAMRANLEELLLRIPHSDGQLPAGAGAATCLAAHVSLPLEAEKNGG